MTERQFQIAFEKQLKTSIQVYDEQYKLTSDTIFHYINRAKDQYIKAMYSRFQYNQTVSDNLRTLVVTTELQPSNIDTIHNKFIYTYPDNYQYTLGEQVSIKILNNRCPNLESKYRDVLEATVETVDKILENSLSEYHLHHNQARPVRVFKDNVIELITDGNYDVDQYILTYLRKSYDLGSKLTEEYTDLPEQTHQEIVDAAVLLYLQEASTSNSSKEDN